MTSYLVAAALVPALVAWIAIELLRRSPLAAPLADHPNERSLHSHPTPRVGGLGIAVAVTPLALAATGSPLPLILACALALCLVSLADDLRSLPVMVRLGAHAAAAIVVMFTWPVASEPGPAAWMVCGLGVLTLMWSTNLYNFMDGSDGLAGGMALIGFGTYAVAAILAGQWPLALVSTALASAAAGFLTRNFPPARVFMGDAGAIPLGFLAAALGIQGYVAGAWPFAFPLLVFSPFVADASMTLARRALRRETLWRAHRSHYYQRLVLAGWSPRKLLAAAYGLMLAVAASALMLARAGVMLQCGIISAWVVAFALAFLAIDRRTTTTAGTSQ